MEIRRMQREDIPTVAKLYLAAYGVKWNEAGAERYITKFFEFDPGNCLCATEPNATVSGAVLGYSFEREFGLVLFIQELMVHPEYRKRGYGKQLVAALRESCEKSPSRVSIKPLVKADTGVLNFYN